MPFREMADPRFDLDTLMRAKEIEGDPSRLRAAKAFALDEKDRFDRLARDLPGRAGFKNNAVKGSKMEPK